MNCNALVITVDNTVTLKKCDGLEFLKSVVGGYIEIVSMPDCHHHFYVNDNGKHTNLLRNDIATALWRKHCASTDVLVGDVVVLKTTDGNGEIDGEEHSPSQAIVDEAIRIRDTITK